MKVHELKTQDPHFRLVWDRKKTAEIRKADRLFEVGDTLKLRQYCPQNGYGPRSIYATITAITDRLDVDGIMPGYNMLSLGNLMNVIDWTPEATKP